MDPRIYQIVCLSTLIVYGVTQLDFEISPTNVLTILFFTLLSQYIAEYFIQRRFQYKSALISALSLILLLRTNSVPICILASILTIGSKFTIRFKDKHLFNPTNFGLVCTILMTQNAWISPGQWGSIIPLAFLVFATGAFVAFKSLRADISFAFLIAYSLLLTGRAFYLGDPLTIPLHQLQNGALLIFTFFMISDPKSTPNSRAGRIVFAVSVANISYYIRFRFYDPNALVYALALLSPLVPFLDYALPGKRYQWSHKKAYYENNELEINKHGSFSPLISPSI